MEVRGESMIEEPMSEEPSEEPMSDDPSSSCKLPSWPSSGKMMTFTEYYRVASRPLKN